MSRTSLKEVGESLFKVLTIYCRQEVSNWNGVAAEGSNTSAYRGRYKLILPQDWDCSKPTYCAVESVSIVGLPVADEMPRSFAVRSNAFAGENVLEAKRWRQDIDVGGVGTAASPYGLNADTNEVEVSTSNLLALIPNTMFLNYAFDTDIPAAGYLSRNFYKVDWKQDVNFTSLGNKLTLSSAMSIFDLYISSNYDVDTPYSSGYAGTTPANNYKVPLLNRPTQAGTTGPTALNSSSVGGGFTIVLKIYQPITK